MKNGFVIFLAAFTVLFISWSAFVLGPQLQLGGAKQVLVLNSSDVYPLNRPGEANQGLQIYRANGCAACHTEQVQQDGVACELIQTANGNKVSLYSQNLTNHELPGKFHQLGTNQLVSSRGGIQNGPQGKHYQVQYDSSRLPSLPRVIAKNVTIEGAEKLAVILKSYEINIFATGPDISRGWGLRHSVVEDFLYDSPVQLGSLRVGPDLADVGSRLPDANWQLLHLYAPRSVAKDSAMPPFRYLFEIRKKVNGEFSPDALNLPKEFAPADGYEVVPKPEARQLVAYLLSLHANVPLYDAPFTPPQISTNAPSNKK